MIGEGIWGACVAYISLEPWRVAFPDAVVKPRLRFVAVGYAIWSAFGALTLPPHPIRQGAGSWCLAARLVQHAWFYGALFFYPAWLSRRVRGAWRSRVITIITTLLCAFAFAYVCIRDVGIDSLLMATTGIVFLLSVVLMVVVIAQEHRSRRDDDSGRAANEDPPPRSAAHVVALTYTIIAFAALCGTALIATKSKASSQGEAIVVGVWEIGNAVVWCAVLASARHAVPPAFAPACCFGVMLTQDLFLSIVFVDSSVRDPWFWVMLVAETLGQVLRDFGGGSAILLFQEIGWRRAAAALDAAATLQKMPSADAENDDVGTRREQENTLAQLGGLSALVAGSGLLAALLIEELFESRNGASVGQTTIAAGLSAARRHDALVAVAVMLAVQSAASFALRRFQRRVRLADTARHLGRSRRALALESELSVLEDRDSTAWWRQHGRYVVCVAIAVVWKSLWHAAAWQFYALDAR